MIIIPDLTCSTTGTTAITYSLSAHPPNAIPSWVSLNSNSGLLSITAPGVISDTTYSFYVDSTYSLADSSAQKLIEVTVLKWVPSNCQMWSSTSGLVCLSCDSGFVLNGTNCSLVAPPAPDPQNNASAGNASDLSQKSELTAQIITGLVACVSVIESLASGSSLSSAWSMVNQVQLFLLIQLIIKFIKLAYYSKVLSRYFIFYNLIICNFIDLKS